jgi:hypothetical protein
MLCFFFLRERGEVKFLRYWNILDMKKIENQQKITSPSARDSFSNSIAENRNELNR